MLSFIKRIFRDALPAAVDPPALLPAARTGRVGPTIAIVNQSTVVTNQEVRKAVAAIQIQIDRDFAPVWNTQGKLLVVSDPKAIPPGAWVMYLLDTSDQVGALGYHDITDDGAPIGKMFCKDDQKYGLHWTVTLSHEILEMLADPWIQNTVFDQATNTTGTLYALEVADSCEADEFGYEIMGVLVSDFVYPAWFEGFREPNSTKFDHMGVLKAPYELAKGGYIGVFVVGPHSAGWTQRVAHNMPGARLARKGPYSRTNRRKSRGVDMTGT